MRAFTRRFRVRHYELDFLGHLNHAAYVRFMQEAAIEASTEAGYSPEWYRARGTGWVIRRLQIRYSVYLNWIVQVYFDALRLSGHPIEQLRQQGWLTLQGGHDLEYFEPARDNDEIEMISWICEMAKVRGAWTHEIHHANTGKLLARDYSLGIFVNTAGKLIVPPQEIVEDVLRGPVG